MLFSLWFVIGCQTEPPKENIDYSSTIIGKWELKEAFRDNKKTETLDNTTFEVTDNGNITTNFNLKGALATHPFELDGNKIQQKDSENTVYNIVNADSAQMVLTTTLLNINFKLVLEKIAAQEE